MAICASPNIRQNPLPRRVNNSQSKIICLDIETAPILAYAWSFYDTNLIEEVEPWYILCVSWKELGSDKVHNISLRDFSGYKHNKKSDKALCNEVHKLLSEYDIIVAHNGDAFDIKKLNARFAYHGLTPPAPYKTVDTLKIARQSFNTGNNKLKYLGGYFKLGAKLDPGGFELWKGCMVGDNKSWNKMISYCNQDVRVLESLYLKIRPWVKNHPYIGEDRGSCPVCGSKNSQSRGMEKRTGGKLLRRLKCSDCGKYRYEK